MWGIVRSCLGYFSYARSMYGVFMGYTWGIHGVFMGYTYVSGMYRVCIGYVSGMCRKKRDASGSSANAWIVGIVWISAVGQGEF